MKEYRVKKQWFKHLVAELPGQIMHRHDKSGYYVAPVTDQAIKEVALYNLKPIKS